MAPESCVRSVAPAKTILVGEHFVVWGSKALATAISLRVKVEARLLSSSGGRVYVETPTGRGILWPTCDSGGACYLARIVDRIVESGATSFNHDISVVVESEVPMAAGLGSSAATAVAFAAAISMLIGLNADRDMINSLAYEAEKVVHGRPSGIDNTVSTYGSTIVYRRGSGIVETIHGVLGGVKLVLIHTGLERRTRDAVEKVLRVKQRLGDRVAGKLIEIVDTLVDEAVKAIREKDYERLGTIMRVNHGLLNGVTVSTTEIEEIIHRVTAIPGVYGAKVTGAGLGGFVVALVDSDSVERVVEKLKELNLKIYVVDAGVHGVRVERCTPPGR